jgi:DNA-binding HxlR family transcriptional regulator
MSDSNQAPSGNRPDGASAGPAPDAFASACPSRGLIARLGEKWAMLILAALADEPVRFGALKRRLQGVSAKMLRQTLRGLERDGLIFRTELALRPIAVDYRLTDRGRDLLPLVIAFKTWAEAHLHDIEADNRRFDDHGFDD